MKFRALQWDYHSEAVAIERELEERQAKVQQSAQKVSPQEPCDADDTSLQSHKTDDDEDIKDTTITAPAAPFVIPKVGRFYDLFVRIM